MLTYGLVRSVSQSHLFVHSLISLPSVNTVSVPYQQTQQPKKKMSSEPPDVHSSGWESGPEVVSGIVMACLVLSCLKLLFTKIKLPTMGKSVARVTSLKNNAAYGDIDPKYHIDWKRLEWDASSYIGIPDHVSTLYRVTLHPDAQCPNPQIVMGKLYHGSFDSSVARRDFKLLLKANHGLVLKPIGISINEVEGRMMILTELPHRTLGEAIRADPFWKTRSTLGFFMIDVLLSIRHVRTLYKDSVGRKVGNGTFELRLTPDNVFLFPCDADPHKWMAKLDICTLRIGMKRYGRTVYCAPEAAGSMAADVFAVCSIVSEMVRAIGDGDVRLRLRRLDSALIQRGLSVNAALRPTLRELEASMLLLARPATRPRTLCDAEMETSNPDLECVVCLELMVKAVSLTPCNHNVCSTCVAVLPNNKCPHCVKDIKSSGTDHFVQRQAAKERVKCRRCSVVMTAEAFLAHSCLCLLGPAPSTTDADIVEQLKTLADRGMEISVVTLEKCANVTDLTIKYIAICCPKLKSLRINRCPKITGSMLGLIGQGCKELTSLQLKNMKGLTDSDVDYLLVSAGVQCSSIRRGATSLFAKSSRLEVSIHRILESSTSFLLDWIMRDLLPAAVFGVIILSFFNLAAYVTVYFGFASGAEPTSPPPLLMSPLDASYRAFTNTTAMALEMLRNIRQPSPASETALDYTSIHSINPLASLMDTRTANQLLAAILAASNQFNGYSAVKMVAAKVAFVPLLVVCSIIYGIYLIS